MGFAKEKRAVLADSFKGIASGIHHKYGPPIQLSSANLLAMGTTPVSVLPAPATGKLILVNWIIFVMKRTSTAYAAGGAINFQYHTTTTSTPHAGTIAATVLTTSGAATTQTMLGMNVGSSGLVLPTAEGIDITNAGGAFTTGTGTAEVYIDYDIVTIF